MKLCASCTYFGEWKWTPSCTILGLKGLGRNDPFAPANLVEVDRQFPPLAKGPASIFRYVESGVVDVLLLLYVKVRLEGGKQKQWSRERSRGSHGKKVDKRDREKKKREF